MLVLQGSGGWKQVWIAIPVLVAMVGTPAWARVHADQSATPAAQTPVHHKAAHPAATHHSSTPSNAHASHSAAARTAHASRTRTVTHRHRRHVLTARERARSRRYQHAFVASSQLRPMAQQLAQDPTPAAFSGIQSWAHSHTGEAAAAAYLAIGHAYLLQRKFSEAVGALHSADLADSNKTNPDGALADYVDYLTAQAYLQNNQLPQAETVLDRFARKYPDSIFADSIPVLRANLMVQEGDPQAALTTLNPHRQEAVAGKVDFQLALAKAESLAGNTSEAQQLFEHVYLDYPLSIEAGVARSQLATNGILATLPPEERRRHADALYNAGHFADAEDEYRSLAGQSNVDEASRTALLVAAAECDWKLHRLTPTEINSIPDSNDDTGARRMYLLMELARDRGDQTTQQSIVTAMETRFPTSVWLAEALYSSGNMYLLLKDYPHAITYYGELARRFPTNKYAPSAHWRTGWLNYRLGQYPEAARLFDEQIRVYAGGKEIPSAIYWRGRVYEDEEKNPASAAEYYRTILRVFPHYYYAMLAQDRLSHLGAVMPEANAILDALQPTPVPELTDDVPEDDPHVVKARLLANAGLNEYIAPEIRASDGSDEWGAFAEAEIYASYGESWHAMRLLKRAIPFYTSAPIEAIPVTYWRILFPQTYWTDIRSCAEQNGLDPYMVAALIRQETEFNPGAISNKNAYGLMQLLPAVGRSLARQVGIRHFQTSALLNPSTNIRLGTLYLKQTLEKFGGQPEYAFAAYNAGDDRVTDWQSVGNYHGIDEFVESIPFTETREYVEAILRNEQIYRELDKVTAQRAQR